MSKLLEVCVDSVESALEAAKGGAGRIELCSALSEGGLTPTVGLLKIIKQNMNPKIPIFVMLRPRRGNDFNYSALEMEAILADMELFFNYGADGFVFGSLTSDCKIDIVNCRRIIAAAKNLPVTFHRAIDVTKREELFENCKIIKELGFKRILTSGMEASANLGIETIKKMFEDHGNEIIIVPGAGINANNLGNILKETGCTEFHASARKRKLINMSPGINISMGGHVNDLEDLLVTDANIVQELVSIGNSF